MRRTNQPFLKLPFIGKLSCSQPNQSGKGQSHYAKYKNTKYALDFTLNGKTPFKVIASADGKIKMWKCCNHNNGKCKCGLGFGNQKNESHRILKSAVCDRLSFLGCSELKLQKCKKHF